MSGELQKIRNAMIDGSWVNVKDFITDENDITNAIKDAIYSSNGKTVKIPSGRYNISYLQLSGLNSEPHYIGTDVLKIEGEIDTVLVMKDFIGETQPSNLGIKYGYTPSAFSLYNFKKVEISNIKIEGTLFNNFIEDAQIVTSEQGTIESKYYLRNGGIYIGECDDIKLKNIYCEKMFKGIVLRDLEKPKVKNCEVNYCFKGFDLQDVNFAYLDKCSVYNARFDLTETHHSLQIFDVYNRSDNTLLYTINAGGIVTEGIKINDGYGFIIQGVNNKLRDCYTYMCGSDDYRVQNLGYTSKDNYFINCISDYPARYAFSVRSETCENTYFINCEARYGNDITKWNAIIPETLVDALLPPASNNEYDTWWTYRTPKRSCRHFYAHGFNTVFDNCKSFSKKPLEIDVTPRYTSNGEMTYLPSHLRTFNSHDILVKDSKFYGEVAGTGLIQMAGYNIDNKVTLDNCIIEGETGLSVSDTTYAGIYFSDNLLGEYLLKDNTINGCGDGYYFIGNINPKNFISKNNNLINQSRSNYFINTDITLSNGLNFIKETTRGARHSIDLRQPIRNIFFIDCDFKHTTASLNPIRLSNYNGTDINNIYFKEGSNYVMFIDALTTTTNRQSLFERIKINNIDFINILAENPSAGHLELLLKVIGNTITGSDINLMNVYNSSNVLRYLTIRRDAAGSNKSYFNIKVSNVDIAGLYKIYYTPLRNSTDLIV